jgi:hypothetical protein
MIDLFSHWVEVMAVPADSAADVVYAIHERIVPTHGYPEVIVTDRGSHFRNALMKTFVEKYDIRHVFTTAYHPQANGIIERMHLDLKNAIDALIDESDLSVVAWDEILFQAVLVQHTRRHSGLGVSPDMLVMGRHLRTGSQVPIGTKERRILSWWQELSGSPIETSRKEEVPLLAPGHDGCESRVLTDDTQEEDEVRSRSPLLSQEKGKEPAQPVSQRPQRNRGGKTWKQRDEVAMTSSLVDPHPPLEVPLDALELSRWTYVRLLWEKLAQVQELASRHLCDERKRREELWNEQHSRTWADIPVGSFVWYYEGESAQRSFQRPLPMVAARSTIDRWTGPFFVQEVFNGGLSLSLIHVHNLMHRRVAHRMRVKLDHSMSDEEKKTFSDECAMVDRAVELRKKERELLRGLEYVDSPGELEEEQSVVSVPAQYRVEECFEETMRPNLNGDVIPMVLVRYSGWPRPFWVDREVVLQDAPEHYQRMLRRLESAGMLRGRMEEKQKRGEER